MDTRKAFDDLYIYRERHDKEVVLYSKLLVLCNHEEEAAKLFYKWMQEHPDYDMNEIHFRIDTVVEEEDHYGHFGGTNYYLKIYRNDKESDAEYQSRIKNLEERAERTYDRFLNELTNEFLLVMLPGLSNEEKKEYKKRLAETYTKKLKNQILDY